MMDSGLFTLTSAAFAGGARMPDRHTCAGSATHVSPPLAWVNPPPGTQSFAILVRDPQSVGDPANNYHWAIYDIALSVSSLTESVPAGAAITTPTSARQALASFGGISGFFYACPPPGSGVHNYTFVIHALSVATLPASPTSAPAVEAAVNAVSLGSATLVGTYSR